MTEKRQPRHRIHFRAHREASGKTQRQVALALEVAQNTVAYWDAGRQPSVEYLPDLAQLFECTIEDLYSPPRT
ncbi:helix-turn-helix transcriptional regulator [Nonomuraea sp. NPDC004354]